MYCNVLYFIVSYCTHIVYHLVTEITLTVETNFQNKTVLLLILLSNAVYLNQKLKGLEIFFCLTNPNLLF